jgi:predicted small lipoprotein YifL
MKNIARIYLALAVAFAISGCGDKQDSADKAQEAQEAIQQGMQKEKAMMEGMQKGVEDIQKKMSEQQAK